MIIKKLSSEILRPFNFKNIFFLIFLLLSAIVYQDGIKKNLDKVIGSAIEDNTYAIAVAISDNKYDLNKGYLLFRNVYSSLEKNGLTTKQHYLDKLNHKFPKNLQDINLANEAIKNSLYMNLSTSPGIISGDLMPSGGDIGLADYYKIAFDLFGYKTQSAYKLYFLILIFSSFLFFFTLNRGLYFIIPFIYLFSLFLIIDQIYKIDHIEISHIKTQFNLGTIYNFRNLSTLGIIPCFNILFLILNKKDLNIFQSLAFVLQSLIIIFVFSIRISSHWILLLILAITFIYFILRYLEVKDFPKLYDLFITNVKKFSIFLISLILIVTLIKNFKSILGFPYNILIYIKKELLLEKNFFSLIEVFYKEHTTNLILIVISIFLLIYLWKKYIKFYFNEKLLILDELKNGISKPTFLLPTFLILMAINSIFFNLKLNTVFFTPLAKSTHMFYHNAFIGLSMHPDFQKKYAESMIEGGFNELNFMDSLAYNEAYRQYKKKFPIKGDDFDFNKHFTSFMDGGFYPDLMDWGAKKGLIEFIKKDPVFFLESYYHKLFSIFEYFKVFINQSDKYLSILILGLFFNFSTILISLKVNGFKATYIQNLNLSIIGAIVFIFSLAPLVWAYPSFFVMTSQYITYFFMNMIFLNIIFAILFYYKFNKCQKL